MKFHHTPPRMQSMLLMCCLAAVFPIANAAETDTSSTTQTTTSTAVGTSQNTEAKLVAEFVDFLGGEEQAQTVVSGLRQGSSFDLVTETTTTETTTNATTGETTTSTTTTITTTTIDPPTGTMGYGNIRIALRLAQSELAELGITEATPEQLSAILIGGEINSSQVNGILAMRADGMGWGQIAQSYGTTVGQLMGNGKGLAKQPVAAATQTKEAGKPTSGSSSTTKSSSAPKSNSNGYIASGKPVGAGIVNGMGSTMNSSGNGKSQANKTANAQGGGNSGIGKSLSVAGVSNAGGGGSATAPGQVKKN